MYYFLVFLAGGAIAAFITVLTRPRNNIREFTRIKDLPGKTIFELECQIEGNGFAKCAFDTRTMETL